MLALREVFSEGALKDAQNLAQFAQKMVTGEQHEQRLEGEKEQGKS